MQFINITKQVTIKVISEMHCMLLNDYIYHIWWLLPLVAFVTSVLGIFLHVYSIIPVFKKKS